MKSQSLIIVFGIALVGCGNSGPKPVAKTPDVAEVKVTPQNQLTLFPLVEGNSWTYVMEVSAESVNQPKQTLKAEIVYKVTKVTKNSADSAKVTLSVMQDGKMQDEQEWGYDSKGIFQISAKASKIAFSPKQPVIRFPVKDQDTYKWDGSGQTPVGKLGTMKYGFKNDGMQTVDTEMGQMNALFIQSGGSFKVTNGIEGKVIMNAWYTPGIGLARFRQVIYVKGANSTITLRLKSYNVKK